MYKFKINDIDFFIIISSTNSILLKQKHIEIAFSKCLYIDRITQWTDVFNVFKKYVHYGNNDIFYKSELTVHSIDNVNEIGNQVAFSERLIRHVLKIDMNKDVYEMKFFKLN